MSAISSVRRTAKQYLPKSVVDWYRKRREIRIYLNQLGENLWLHRLRVLEAEARGEKLTMPLEQAFGEAAIHDIVERSDLILQALERRIEGLNSRHGQQIRNLRDGLEQTKEEVRALREQIRTLRSELSAGPPPSAGAVADVAPASADSTSIG